MRQMSGSFEGQRGVRGGGVALTNRLIAVSDPTVDPG